MPKSLDYGLMEIGRYIRFKVLIIGVNMKTKFIKKLVEIVAERQIQQLEISGWGKSIRISKNSEPSIDQVLFRLEQF